MTLGRNRQSVKVKIRRYRCHQPARTRIRSRFGPALGMKVGRLFNFIWRRGIWRRDEIIPESQHQQVTRLDSEGWGLASIGSGVAVPHVTIWVGLVLNRQIDLENAIVAAEIFWFSDDASGGGPAAHR